MAENDDQRPGGPAGEIEPAPRWPLVAALVAVRPLIVTLAVVLVLFVAFAGLGWGAALLGFGAVLVAALVSAETGRSGPARVSAPPRTPSLWPGAGMRAALDALAEPAFVVDARGVLRFANRAADESFRPLRPGDPLSLKFRQPALLAAVDQVAAGAPARAVDWIDKVPTERWWRAEIAPVRLPGPTRTAPDFVLVVFSEETERRQTERLRVDFVANASHELRTPLASLTGFIETLQGPAKDDPAARERFLAIMLDQAGRMRRLIDDLLSLSRIEMRAHLVPSDTVDLAAVAAKVADALGPLAKAKDVAVERDLPEGPVEVRGDHDELVQVVSNLVENAVKYGASGKRVVVTVAREGEAGERARLTVRDFGPGIAREHVPRLTERFYRVDVAHSRTVHGTGLGLAIVKHILARHRARLTIDTEPGRGAAFTVRFGPAAPEAVDESQPV